MNIFRVALSLVVILGGASAAHAATATWDRNTEPNIGGYLLSYGTQSGVHTTTIDVGNVATYQFFPPAGRRYYVVVQAYNTSGGVGQKSNEAFVDIPAAANQPPTLTQPANQTSAENASASLALMASDPDGTALTYSATGLPPNLSVNASTGVIAGTVTTAGSYGVTATASDGSLSASRTFTWTVTAGDTTAPSVSLSAPANNATVSGSTVTVSATASDAVGVAGVRFRLDGVNLGNEDTSAPYSLVWNTTTATNGSHVLTAVATDAAGNSATSAPVTVTVSNVAANRAPTLTQPANQTSAEGASVSLALVASDPDGNTLTYGATGLPGGLAINSSSGVISGTPTFTSAGAYTVTATASDGSLSSSRTFTWTITNTNRAPVLTQPANQASMVNDTVSLALSASDPDATAVTYGATSLAPGLTINASTGLISGTLTAQSVGVYNATATASDGSLTSSRTFVWGVDNSDIGVSGDFDGDRRDDLATYRASTGEWRIWASRANFALATPVVWGTANDVPVAADYDGDHRTDIGIYRPSTATWHVLLSGRNKQTTLDVRWGDATDRPVPIDYDGDGRADLALARFGGFEILLSSTNYSTSVSVR